MMGFKKVRQVPVTIDRAQEAIASIPTIYY